MLYRLVRPLLFQFEAETAHHLALGFAERLAGQTWLCDALAHFFTDQQPVTLFGCTFPNRVGLAGGMDKNGLAVHAWRAFGFGFVELGTITPLPQEGNRQPRMFRLAGRRAIVNRMGFNNDGAAVVAARLQETPRVAMFPIGISLGKNAITPLDRAEDDYAAAASVLAPQADFVTINVSSPNTTGLRGLQTAEALRGILRAVRNSSAGKPILVKLAPELSGDDLRAVVELCMTESAAGIIATNTLAQFTRAGQPLGGLSGPPLKQLSRDRVGQIRKILGDGPTLM
ncbi:MAG: quinone-dependent dihydroorotate dehydrogenase, partial [Gemmataceae bacterium]